MELRALAQQILFGTTLKDKVYGPPSFAELSDEIPGTKIDTAPELPGRPPDLAFDRRKMYDGQFQGTTKLTDPRARGMILHYFANHELLALEIMSLALLRFVDAPRPFRMGIAGTILEEQDHLRLYIQRMNELGIEFGDLPLNSFFWRTMKDIGSPSEYAAAMSMTFEQANLDFALHYEDLFRAAGDVQTADILRRIHDDEIRHVQHGVTWLQRFHSTESLWDCYKRHLNFPLTPSRAKGPFFDIEGRRRAGIDESFIRELQIFSTSKGRPPDLWVFNPGCEREIQESRHRPFLLDRAAFIERDLAPLLMFLAASDDAVLVAVKPPRESLLELQKAGFDIPEFLEVAWPPDAASISKKMRHRKFGRVKPWAMTEGICRWSQPLTENLRSGALAGYTNPDFFSKSWSAEVASSAMLPRELCPDAAALQNLAWRLHDKGTTGIALKPNYGASGYGLRRVALETILVTGEIQLNNQIKFPIVAEPWLNKVVDLSIQIEVEANGRVRVLDVTRPLIDTSGRYSGHALGRPFTFPDATGQDLSPDFFSRLYPCWLEELRETALQVGKIMARENFRGPAGIDALVHRDPSGALQLQPVVEINPRLTMGRIALSIDRKIARGQPAIWAHLRMKDIQKSGFANFVDFSDQMRTRFPVVLSGHGGGDSNATPDGKRQIKSGYIETTPAVNASGILTALFVGQDAAMFAWKALYPA